MKIGFIGLGIMGKPMAANLLKAGHHLVVYDVVPENVAKLLALGAQAADSSAAVAERSDLVITMLPNSPHVKEAILGDSGVIKGIRPGSIVADMSSITPQASKEIAAQLKLRGIPMVDAPVSGGEPKAVDGTLAIMVGGEESVFKKVESVLRAMGSSVTYVGEIGSGNMAKLANQIIVALNIAAVSEAFALATKAGVDPQKVFQAIRGGLAGSTVMEAKVPKILARDFKPGFRIDLHIKDLANALDTAHNLGVPVPLSAQIMETLQALRNDGQGSDDHSAIARFYEKLGKVEIASQKQVAVAE